MQSEDIARLILTHLIRAPPQSKDELMCDMRVASRIADAFAPLCIARLAGTCFLEAATRHYATCNFEGTLSRWCGFKTEVNHKTWCHSQPLYREFVGHALAQSDRFTMVVYRKKDILMLQFLAFHYAYQYRHMSKSYHDRYDRRQKMTYYRLEEEEEGEPQSIAYLRRNRLYNPLHYKVVLRAGSDKPELYLNKPASQIEGNYTCVAHSLCFTKMAKS